MRKVEGWVDGKPGIIEVPFDQPADEPEEEEQTHTCPICGNEEGFLKVEDEDNDSRLLW